MALQIVSNWNKIWQDADKFHFFCMLETSLSWTNLLESKFLPLPSVVSPTLVKTADWQSAASKIFYTSMCIVQLCNARCSFFLFTSARLNMKFAQRLKISKSLRFLLTLPQKINALSQKIYLKLISRFTQFFVTYCLLLGCLA